MSETVGPGVADVVRVLGALGLVIALVLLTNWLLRNRRAARTGRALTVEDRLTVGRGVHLLVVAAHGRKLLLGVSEKSVSLVADLLEDAPEEAGSGEPGAGSSEAGEELARPLDFAGWLATRLRGRRAKA